MADEVEVILETTRKYYPKYYVLVLTAFRSVLRLGEIAALEWKNIDWHNHQILVEQSWRNSVLEKTKTGEPRKVDISNQLYDELKGLYHQRKVEAVKKGIEAPVGPIWPDKNGIYISQNTIRNNWKRILRKSGLAHRKFHICRHTYASLLLAADNIKLGYVSKQLGHSSVAMTVDIYQHLLPDPDKSAVSVLDSTRAPVAHSKKETPATY